MTLKTNKLSPRLKGRTHIEKLFFKKGAESVTAYPVLAKYREEEQPEGNAPVLTLFSVSKRHFKRAVKRNRVKRQMRETYRLAISKQLAGQYAGSGKQLHIAFVWISEKLYTTQEIEKRMCKILAKIQSRQNLAQNHEHPTTPEAQ